MSTISARPNYEKYKSEPWFVDKVTEDQLNPRIRFLLEERGVPSAELLNHIQSVHDRGFEIVPWPCVANYSFLRTSMARDSHYPAILDRLVNNKDEKIIDLGCALGADIRNLVSSGVPQANIVGLDLHDEFINLGYELFNDRDTLTSSFVIADALEPAPKNLLGQFDFVCAGAFFHVFSWDGQVQAAKFAVSLLKPKAGSAVFGRQVGSLTAKARPVPMAKDGEMFSQNEESFRKLWKLVGEQTNSQWKVELSISTDGMHQFRKSDPDITLIRFYVERLEDGPEGAKV